MHFCNGSDIFSNARFTGAVGSMLYALTAIFTNTDGINAGYAEDLAVGMIPVESKWNTHKGGANVSSTRVDKICLYLLFFPSREGT